jgi:tape measure domain-containing protein
MGVLAEHVVQFRAAGTQSVIGAAERIKGSLSSIGSVAVAPTRALGGAISSVLHPANLLADRGMGIGMSLAQGLASGVGPAVSLATQVERLKGSLSSIGSVAVAPIRALGGAISSVLHPANLLAGMGMGIGMSLAQGLASGIRSAVSLATQVETLSTSFEVLLGSARAAKTMMDEINKFAASTPFEQMELATVAKQLLAYGTAADQIIPTMRRLGDIAALSGANLGDLAAIYGKIQAQGRLTAETLEGFQSRGIPITRELAKAFGVTEAQVRELVSQGKIGFPEVQKAIEALTSQGGQFAGGMERLSKTTAGLWSTVTGNFKTSLAEIGGILIETFNVKGILAWAGNALSSIAEWAAGVRRWISFVRDNWDLAWEMIAEKVSLAVSNTWAYIEAFGTNIVRVVAWFGDNWRNVFTDIYNATSTILTNLFTNMRSLWSSFWAWIKTGRWEFQWKGLTEGFRSTIKEWPRLVEANVRQTTPELERLQREWQRRWQEATEAAGLAGAGTREGPTPGAETAAAKTDEIRSAVPAAVAAGGGGVQFVGFAQLAAEMQRKALEEQQRRMAEAMQRTATNLDKLAALADGNALRVKVEQPVIGVYG